MGEISLECSRSGASAAALWMTLQLLPLTREGMGEIVAPGRRAALAWAEKLRDSEVFDLYQEPDLDIVSYFPKGDSLADVDRRSGAILTNGMNAPRDDEAGERAPHRRHPRRRREARPRRRRLTRC